MAPLRVKHPPATDWTRKASAEFRLTYFSTAPVILSIQIRSPPQGSACFTVIVTEKNFAPSLAAGPGRPAQMPEIARPPTAAPPPPLTGTTLQIYFIQKNSKYIQKFF
jgi:hypothetical protein